MYRDALEAFYKAASELSPEELEEMSQEVLATIMEEGGSFEKQALFKSPKGFGQEFLLKRMSDLKKANIATKRQLVDSKKMIGSLKGENTLLRKGNKLWKGVGAAGVGGGLIGAGYGVVKDQENKQLRGY